MQFVVMLVKSTSNFTQMHGYFIKLLFKIIDRTLAQYLKHVSETLEKKPQKNNNIVSTYPQSIR